MKKKHLIVTGIITLFCSMGLKAQFVDPAASAQQQVLIQLQSKQLIEAIQLVDKTQQVIEKTQKVIDNGKKIYNEAKQVVQFTKKTADIMQAIADDRISIEMIEDLKMNDLKGLMKDMLCVDIDQFTAHNAINIKILARFKSSLLNCSSNNYYNYTFAGIMKQVNEGSMFKGMKNQQDINSLSKQQIDYEMQKIDQAILEANQQYQFAEGAQAGMSNASYKYYHNMADELFDRSKDMYDKLKATKTDSEGKSSAVIEMSQFERQQLIMACIEYQLKAYEYKEKSMAMLKEVSDPKHGMKDLVAYRSKLATRKFNMSVWDPNNNY